MPAPTGLACKMAQWISEFAIPCELETKDAYAYICQPERKGELEAEAAAAHKLGLQAEVLDAAPLPFATVGDRRSDLTASKCLGIALR
jgi:hypothetical protein